MHLFDADLVVKVSAKPAPTASTRNWGMCISLKATKKFLLGFSFRWSVYHFI
jgi:hypothetical protein